MAKKKNSTAARRASKATGESSDMADDFVREAAIRSHRPAKKTPADIETAKAFVEDARRRKSLPSEPTLWKDVDGGSGKWLSFADEFRKATLGEKVALLDGESPQVLNAVAVKAIGELRSLEKVKNSLCEQLIERRESLDQSQFAALLETATARTRKALADQLAPPADTVAVPVRQVRSLKDLESLRYKFFQAVVFGDAEPSLKRFEDWLKKMAGERFPDFESKQTAAQAAVYWQSVLADGLLRLDGKECLFTATKGERGSGVFRARFRKSGESTAGTGEAQDKQEYSGVTFPSLTTE